MIILNDERTYVNYYLMKKEILMSLDAREALNKIYYYMNKKNLSKHHAVNKVHKYYKDIKNVILEKSFLRSKYNARQAHVKNGKEEYKKWLLDIRKKACGIELPFCACGCGQRVTKLGNKYIKGHNRRCLPQEVKDINAANMREQKRLKKERSNVIELDKRRNVL